MNKLWEAINRIQRERNMSDANLAQLLDIPASNISYYKSGKRNIGMKNALKVYETFPELLKYIFNKTEGEEHAPRAL